MLAIGAELRAARERKGLALEQVADETNIAKRYLGALESEDFAVFPGDPYIIGFLRNYAEYLGLDAREFVASFKGLRIQEQPVPMQELIPAPKRVSPLVYAGVAVGVLGLAALGFVVAGAFKAGAAAEAARVAEATRVPETLVLESASFERRLYPGDALDVPFGEQKYRVKVAEIADRLALETPSGTLRFMLGEEGGIDLDRDNLSDLLVFVADFSRGEPDKGALVRFVASGALAQALNAASALASAGAAPALGATLPAGSPPAGAAAPAAVETAPQPGAKFVNLFTGNISPYPFVLTGTFVNYAMLRYEVDRRDREERYYRKGDTITINANNAVKVWTSNAGSSRLTVQASGGKTASIELGASGEVAVKRLAWYKGDSGDWILALFDVE